ncbi:MAG: DinB family protein [Actinomycetota bacterium]
MSAGPPPPQRVPADVDAARSSVTALTDTLEATVSRASSFTEDELNRSIDDEWSTVESLRHIVFVIDLWLGRVIQGEEDPFHPIGLPPHFAPRVLPGSSIDPEASPTFDEACGVLRGRLGMLASFVAELSDDELARSIGTHAETVAGGLGVVFDELTYHDVFINRDLTKIEQARP